MEVCLRLEASVGAFYQRRTVSVPGSLVWGDSLRRTVTAPDFWEGACSPCQTASAAHSGAVGEYIITISAFDQITELKVLSICSGLLC